AAVRDGVVLDAGVRQRALERGVVVRSDVLIVARLQREDRRADLSGAVDRLGRTSVEPDRAPEAVAARSREPRVASAEAEADRDDAADPLFAEVLDGGADVGHDALGRRLLDVRHVLEVVVPLLRAGRAPEVVNGDRRV